MAKFVPGQAVQRRSLQAVGLCPVLRYCKQAVGGASYPLSVSYRSVSSVWSPSGERVQSKIKFTDSQLQSVDLKIKFDKSRWNYFYAFWKCDSYAYYLCKEYYASLYVKKFIFNLFSNSCEG